MRSTNRLRAPRGVSAVSGVGALFVFVFVVSALGGGSARASTRYCANVMDGTPCDNECTQGGTCQRGVCAGGQSSVDGTACATGGFCTVLDYCLAGVCQPGMPRVCARMPCSAGACVPGVGCVYKTGCDLAMNADLEMAAADLGAPDLDGGVDSGATPDLGVPDAPLPATDAAPPTDAAVPADLARTPRPDLAAPPADLARAAPDLTMIAARDLIMSAGNDQGSSDGGDLWDGGGRDASGSKLDGSDGDLGAQNADAGSSTDGGSRDLGATDDGPNAGADLAGQRITDHPPDGASDADVELYYDVRGSGCDCHIASPAASSPASPLSGSRVPALLGLGLLGLLLRRAARRRRP